MFKAAMRGERRGGDTLGTSGDGVMAVGIFGDVSRGVATLGGGLRRGAAAG